MWFSTNLTIFSKCFLYLLKTVEIVIIQASKERSQSKYATTGTESIGKSRAHILCAVHAGRDKFCCAIHCFYYRFYNRFEHIWG